MSRQRSILTVVDVYIQSNIDQFFLFIVIADLI